uniref:TNFR-Cys domain-containing protein n=1 Tax=Globisporangium ultimum (strain ATCC 200006 / CBS 805.95 / DAOM BR144) TaxID=431595 RepID=K3W7B6_GLOUD
MVFPRSDGSRSLSKFALLCALNLCLLQGAQYANAAGTCLMAASSGDSTVGIKIVADSSCRVNPGTGCIGINSDCRFCKTKDSPQSLHFTACDEIDPPSPAPTPTTTTKAPQSQATSNAPVVVPSAAPAIVAPTSGPTTVTPTENPVGNPTSISAQCGIADGDLAVGVEVIDDSSCASGGLGCFNNHCRFCKVGDTPQSKHLLSCISLGADYPTISPMNTNAPSSACEVSQGDFNVGINVVSDATCANGGLGCYDGHCRFCKYNSTPSSVHLNDCSTYGLVSAPTPTTAPLLVAGTLDVVAGPTPRPTVKLIPTAPAPIPTTPGPTPCPSSEKPDGGILEVAPTPTPSETLTPTTRSPTPIPSPAYIVTPKPTPSPTPTTPAPTTIAPGPTPCPSSLKPTPSSEKPSGGTLDVVSTPTPTSTSCSSKLSAGDANVGIQVITWANCAKEGGVGCFDTICRFCRVWTTPQSKHLDSCTSFGYFGSPVGTSLEVTPSPSDATVVPLPLNSGLCVASPGDNAVGIHGVVAANCAADGLGCFENNFCRYCKVTDTPQSAHLHSCSSLSSFVGTPLTPAPSPTSAGSCTVSAGDSAVGISAIYADDCDRDGLGCFLDSQCRYCKLYDTIQSAHLHDCVPPTFVSDPSWPASDTVVPFPSDQTPTPAMSGGLDGPIGGTADVSSNCFTTVSEGDRKAGIQIVGDDSCGGAEPGVGCIDSACRFCKFRDTTESAGFLPCTQFGYDFFDDAVTLAPSPQTPSEPATVTSESCAAKVSEGDKRVGIYGVADVECLKGGIGCNDKDICRLCRLVDTPQSHHLAACPISIVTTTPVSAVVTPAPPTNEPLSTSVTSDTCAARVSTDDKNVGISAIADPTCAQGGVGCNEIDICRLCKINDTPQSSHYVACSPSASTSAPSTGVVAPTRSTSITAASCAAKVSKGDDAVGISSTVDFSCLSGGTGCNDADVCRLCYMSITPQSSHLPSAR